MVRLLRGEPLEVYGLFAGSTEFDADPRVLVRPKLQPHAMCLGDHLRGYAKALAEDSGGYLVDGLLIRHFP